MMLQLLRAERLKLRRSLGLLMTLACPAMVVALMAAMVLRQKAPSAFDASAWEALWAGSTALWSYFMLPLYVALVTCLVNGAEHKAEAWRLMLTLPISRGQLFLAKALTSWTLVVAANVVLLLLILVVIGVLGALGYPLAGAFRGEVALALMKIPLVCLPILAIQHAISWRLSSVVPPLAIGVIATMGITQLGSSEYWVYYPWSYVLVAVNGNLPQAQTQALLLALAVGAGLYVVSGWWLSRREACY